MKNIRSPNKEKQNTVTKQITRRKYNMRETTFEEFINMLIKEVKENLPEELENATVEVQTVTKNNNTELKSLLIKIEGENLTPSIYLEQFYKDYRNNKMELEEIVSKVIELRIKHRKDTKMDLNYLEDFEAIKKDIIPTFAGLKEYNKELMESCPYVKILDMVMVFRIVINMKDENGVTGTILIKDDLQNKLGVTTQTLFETALKNVKGNFKCKNMGEIFKEMMGASDLETEMFNDNPMYVLTNKEMTFGAAAIIDEEFMWDVYDKIGGDFIIIPSSIHELIAIPMTEMENNADYVNNMIKDVNRTQVEQKDRLSNHAYKFTKENALEVM